MSRIITILCYIMFMSMVLSETSLEKKLPLNKGYGDTREYIKNNSNVLTDEKMIKKIFEQHGINENDEKYVIYQCDLQQGKYGGIQKVKYLLTDKTTYTVWMYNQNDLGTDELTLDSFKNYDNTAKSDGFPLHVIAEYPLYVKLLREIIFVHIENHDHGIHKLWEKTDPGHEYYDLTYTNGVFEFSDGYKFKDRFITVQDVFPKFAAKKLAKYTSLYFKRNLKYVTDK